jgi:hypothetical protein
MIDLRTIFTSLSPVKYLFILIEYIPALLLVILLNLALAPIVQASQNIETLIEDPISAISTPMGVGLESYYILTQMPLLFLLLFLSLILTFGVDPLLRAFLFRIAGKKIDMKKDFAYAKSRYWAMFGASFLMFIIYTIPIVMIMLISFFSRPTLLIHDILNAVTIGTVNVFLYMTNPLVALKKKGPVEAIKKSGSMFMKRKKDILTVFLIITFLSVGITYLIQRLAFGIDPEIGSLVKSDFAVMISYMSASLTILIVQGIISSFFDYVHINARVKLLKES